MISKNILNEDICDPNMRIIKFLDEKKNFWKRNNDLFINNNQILDDSKRNLVQKNFILRKKKLNDICLRKMYLNDYYINYYIFDEFSENFPEYIKFLDIENKYNMNYNFNEYNFNSELKKILSKINIDKKDLKNIFSENYYSNFIFGIILLDDFTILFCLIGIRKILCDSIKIKSNNMKNLYFGLKENLILEKLINLSIKNCYRPLILETLKIIQNLIFIRDNDILHLLKQPYIIEYIFDIFRKENEILVFNLINSILFNLLIEYPDEFFILFLEKNLIGIETIFIKNFSIFHIEIFIAYRIIFVFLDKFEKFNKINNGKSNFVNFDRNHIFSLIDLMINEMQLYFFYISTNNFKNLDDFKIDKILNLQTPDINLKKLERYELEILKLRYCILIIKKMVIGNVINLKYLIIKHENIFYFLLELIKEIRIDTITKIHSLEILDNFLFHEISSYKIEVYKDISDEFFMILIMILDNNKEVIKIIDNNIDFYIIVLFSISNLLTNRIFTNKFLYPKEHKIMIEAKNKEKLVKFDYSPFEILKQIHNMYFTSFDKSLHKEILFVIGNILSNIDDKIFKFLIKKNFLKIYSDNLKSKHKETIKICIESLLILVNNDKIFSKNNKISFFEKINTDDIFFQFNYHDNNLSKSDIYKYELFLDFLENLEYEIIQQDEKNCDTKIEKKIIGKSFNFKEFENSLSLADKNSNNSDNSYLFNCSYEYNSNIDELDNKNLISFSEDLSNSIILLNINDSDSSFINDI